MTQKTLLLLVLFAGLVGAALVARRLPEKGERAAADRPRPVASIAAGSIDELEVTSGKDKTQLKKQDGKWRVVAPIAYGADEPAVKSAIEKLEGLQWGDVVSSQKDKHREFEVDEEKGVRVVARKGGAALADLLVGKTMSGYTLVRPYGKDEVWQAVGVLKWVYAKDTKGWRDKTILSFERESCEKVEVEGARGKVVAKRIPADKDKKTPEKWELVESPVKVDKLDESVPGGVLSTLYSLRTFDFADGVTLGDAGLEPPAYKVTAELKGGARKTVLIGKQKGEDFHIKTPDGAQVYLVRKYTVERLTKPPLEFRDKSLVDIKADDVVGLEIKSGTVELLLEKSGEDWKAKRPPKLEVDSAKVKPIASAFTALKAASFAESTDAKTTGLAKPTGRVIVRTKDRKAVTLVIGTLKDNTDYFVQVAGRPDIYMLKKYSVDRFLKKPDDIKKGGASSS
jgi:hypothetical protein